MALGTRAIENGFSVSFCRVDELMYQLKRDADISPSRLKHKKYMASNLLILDEFGYQPLRPGGVESVVSGCQPPLPPRFDRDDDQQIDHVVAGGAWRRRGVGWGDPGPFASLIQCVGPVLISTLISGLPELEQLKSGEDCQAGWGRCRSTEIQANRAANVSLVAVGTKFVASCTWQRSLAFANVLVKTDQLWVDKTQQPS